MTLARRRGRTTVVAMIVLVAAIAAGCGHPEAQIRPAPAPGRVLVELDARRLPIGTAVHLCLRDLPCTIYTVRADGRGSDVTTMPLPAGISARAAAGWPLRARAVAGYERYRARTTLVYHQSVDLLCRCAGDYAYVRLAPA